MKREIVIDQTDGASLRAISSQVDLAPRDGQPDTEWIGIQMPATGLWTPADLTFQVALDKDGTFQNLFDDAGSEVKLTVDAARIITFGGNTAALLGRWRFVKVRSGTSVLPVSQAAARTLFAFKA